MQSTTVTLDAARRLRSGTPWASREDIVSVEGAPEAGSPVRVTDPDGRSLGWADLDLDAAVSVRRLGADDEPAEGLIQRHIRRALNRRAQRVMDPRYARGVNDDGDQLPGLIADRFDGHWVIQTSSRAMDTRLPEIARSLMEIAGARSVLVRNDTRRREALGLPLSRPHVLLGAPPRWTFTLELGSRVVFDMQMGPGTGYPYDLREVRRVLRRWSQGARVLDLCCGVGDLLVHAGLGGAKEILAFEADAEAADLARENAEANGLHSHLSVVEADPLAALDEVTGSEKSFDLVLLRADNLIDGASPEDAFVALAGQALRAVRHGGLFVAITRLPPPLIRELDALMVAAGEQAHRHVLRAARIGLPADFPTVLDPPHGEAMKALAVEAL